jgi:hypothetical protein
MSRLVRIVLIVLVFVLVAAGAIGGFCWWKMSKLKGDLVQGLQDAIGAHVEIASLDFDFWKGELHAAGISLTNNRPSAPWEKGAISQATVHFQWSDAFSSTVPLSVEVSSWNIVMTPSTNASGGLSEPPPPPSRFQVTRITGSDGTVEVHLSGGSQMTLNGIQFDSNPNGAGVWKTQLEAKSIKAGDLEAGTSSVDLLGDPDKITFSNLRMTCGSGFITGDGEVALGGSHDLKANLKATEVPVTMLVGVAWQMKVSGQVTGDLAYTGNDQSGSAQGNLTLEHPKFNLLPWLGKTTALAGLPDITDVELDKATADFTWKDHALELTNIDVRKNDVARITGTADVAADSQVDAKLKLGLPSTITAKWPALQDKVFTAQSEDYNWTDVHLTGTPDHLQEDLSARLLAVGMQQGGSVIDQAEKKASDLLKGFMGQ